MDEPRTLLDMMEDLLQFARDRQWSGQRNTSCHCHPDYHNACPECHVFEYKPGVYDEQSDHAPDCKLAALIREVDAFLTAEQASLAQR